MLLAKALYCVSVGSGVIVLVLGIQPSVATLPAADSVSQIALSGPTATPSGDELDVGSVSDVSDVSGAFGLIRPNRLALDSVNQMLPSGPVTMPFGPALLDPSPYWLI